MCRIVVDQTGNWLSSPRDLAALGWDVELSDCAFPAADYAEIGFMDSCFCSVDVEGVLIRHGVPYWVDDAGFIILGDAP